jgi:threonine dehydrogenase-like Zn-dependent dehydrogenase
MFSTVFATDPTPARRELAAKHGAIALPIDELKQAVLDATDGRGADAALELVGNESALHASLDLVRNFGVVSSIGMHIRPVTLDGGQLYGKK